MSTCSRRSFLARSAMAAASLPLHAAATQSSPSRHFTLCLSPGSIGVSAGQNEAITLAYQHGFESVEPYGDHLASLTQPQIDELLASLKQKNLAWGAAGLPVDFRSDDAKFADGLKQLPRIASGLQRAGVSRIGTWISPGHSSLTYTANFQRHASRLREIAVILKDHNLRFGLEYVGTPTLWRNQRYPFIHTLAETRDLIAAIDTGNVGIVLDSWHWTMAGDTEADLLNLRNENVISVDLNDAPAGIPKDQQQDGRRELPCATGVLDLTTFLKTIVRISYDGPVRAEPFNKPLNDLDNEAACAATIVALRKAAALAGT